MRRVLLGVAAQVTAPGTASSPTISQLFYLSTQFVHSLRHGDDVRHGSIPLPLGGDAGVAFSFHLFLGGDAAIPLLIPLLLGGDASP